MELNHRPLRIIQNHRPGARLKSPASVLVTCNKHIQPRVNVRFKLTDPQKYVFEFVLTENKLWFLSYSHQSNLLVDFVFLTCVLRITQLKVGVCARFLVPCFSC